MPSSRNISTGFILFCVFYFSNLSPSISVEPAGVRRDFFRELLRVKRQECTDGTYEYDGRNCCLCPAGQRVKDHCTATPGDGKCEICEKNTYNSEPNRKDKCDLCRSCDQANANTEVEEECTAYRDAKCKCKKDHYCTDPTGVCLICHPCDICESTGVKEACTPTSNTVCYEESKGLGGGGVAGIVIAVLVLAAAAAVAVVFRKKISGLFKSKSGSSSPSNPASDPLNPADMENHLQDVADILGWKDMRAVALKSNIPMSVIDGVKLSHPNDSESWTIDLLEKWMQKMGRTASVDLIRILRERGKNAKADKIVRELYGSDPS